eukprot:4157999-Pyramimonas_sp.AAC.1
MVAVGRGRWMYDANVARGVARPSALAVGIRHHRGSTMCSPWSATAALEPPPGRSGAAWRADGRQP